MKNKFSSMWRVAITLVLIASLGLVFNLPAAAQDSELDLTITEPVDDWRVNTCREFTIHATLTNNESETMGSVEAEISWLPLTGASLEGLKPALQELPDIPPGATVDIPFWHLHCFEAGPLAITVEVKGITDPGQITFGDIQTVTIFQDDPATLETTMLTAETCFGISNIFEIAVQINNNGDEDAINVSVPDDVKTSGPASKVSGPTWTWPDGAGIIPGGEFALVIWEYHCVGAGDADFTVTPTGVGANTGDVIQFDPVNSPGYVDPTSASVTIHQLPLIVTITFPSGGETYSESQEFLVEASLNNPSVDEDLTNIEALLEWTGPANLVIGDNPQVFTTLNAGETDYAAWTVHCNGSGEVTFTVKGSTDWNWGYQFTFSDPVTVNQELATDLEVEILSPGGPTAELVTGGYGTAEWSTDQAKSGKHSVELYPGTTDWVDWAGVQIASGEALTDFITTGSGDVAVLDVSQTYFYYNIEDGILGQVPIMAFVFEVGAETWKLVLAPELPTWETGTGEWVKLMEAFTTGHLFKEVAGTFDHWTAGYIWGTPPLFEELGWWQNNENSPIKEMTVDYVEVSVGTELATVYVDDVTINGVTYDLETMDTYIGTSSDFAVTARVTNVGEADSLNTSVTIDPGTKASVKSPDVPTINLQTLAGGASEIVSWTVHCDESGTTAINVSATGIDENSNEWKLAEDSVSVEQYAKAHLEVEITQFPPEPIDVCSNFTVTATITNTGEADAWEVSATLSVFPELSAKVTDGGYTQPVGTLVGHGEDGSAIVEWTLHCKMASESTITITAAGFDEFGWHLKQDPQTGETILVSMPGRAIPENNIEPASDTVKQEEPSALADLEVTKSVDPTGSVEVGDTVTFTITVENLGPADATSIWVWDLLPAGVNISSQIASQGFYYVTSGNWGVGDLAMGESATLTIVATVNAVGDIYNMATVDYCDQHDPDTGNNAQMVTITGLAAPPITTVALVTGYNLISLPLIPENSEIVTLLGVIDVNGEKGVAYWTGGPAGGWLFYKPNYPTLATLFTMEDGKGYWIDMLSAGTISYTGYEISAPPPSVPPSYDLVQGWNLLGFKSTTPKLPEVYLAAIDGKYTVIYGFADGAYFIVGTPGREFFQTGLGYWIAMTDAGTVYP